MRTKVASIWNNYDHTETQKEFKGVPVMYKMIPVLALLCFALACNPVRLNQSNLVFEDKIAKVYLIKGEEYFDGMVLYLEVNEKYFKGVEGAEPFYKETENGLLFFTYATERGQKTRPWYLNIYNPKTGKHTYIGPYELVYYFDPNNDKVIEENNNITIYPQKGRYKSISVDTENKKMGYVLR